MSRWHTPDEPDFPGPPGPKLEGPKLPSHLSFEIMKKWAANQPLSEQDLAALLWKKEREKVQPLVRNEKGVKRLLRLLENRLFDAIKRFEDWAEQHDTTE